MKRNTFSKKIAAYSMAVGAGAVLAQDADAEVHYYSAQITLLENDGEFLGQWIDINGDGVDDFEFLAYFSTYYLRGPVPNNATLLDEADNRMAQILAPGESIEPGAGTFAHFARLDNFIGTNGYVGVVFDIPGGSPHYGYLLVAMPLDSNRATLYGGGYESRANTPIRAGDVPEPTTLALLAGGATTLATWRKRRPVS